MVQALTSFGWLIFWKNNTIHHSGIYLHIESITYILFSSHYSTQKLYLPIEMAKTIIELNDITFEEAEIVAANRGVTFWSAYLGIAGGTCCDE